jgi:hypothetical protein
LCGAPTRQALCPSRALRRLFGLSLRRTRREPICSRERAMNTGKLAKCEEDHTIVSDGA